VKNSGISTLNHSLDDLCEHSLCISLWQRTLLCDEVKQVFALEFLHHNVIAVRRVKTIQDLHNSLNLLHLLHQRYLNRKIIVLVVCLVSGVLHNLLHCHLNTINLPLSCEHSSKPSFPQHLLDNILCMNVSFVILHLLHRLNIIIVKTITGL